MHWTTIPPESFLVIKVHMSFIYFFLRKFLRSGWYPLGGLVRKTNCNISRIPVSTVISGLSFFISKINTYLYTISVLRIGRYTRFLNWRDYDVGKPSVRYVYMYTVDYWNISTFQNSFTYILLFLILCMTTFKIILIWLLINNIILMTQLH